METDQRKNTTFSITTKINTLLYVGDQVVTADLENNLQRGEFTS
jgi:hypothetical protein